MRTCMQFDERLDGQRVEAYLTYVKDENEEYRIWHFVYNCSIVTCVCSLLWWHHCLRERWYCHGGNNTQTRQLAVYA